MTAKIYIASKPLSPTAREHLYLVYDADGDPTTLGDEEVIRGGDFLSENIWIEKGVAIGDSADDFTSGENYITRNFTELDVSGINDVNTVWAGMKSTVETLGTQDGGNALIYNSTVGYHLLGPNSNSLVATILYRSGLDIAADLPHLDGIGSTMPLGTFTGWNGLLGTAENDTWNVDLAQPASRTIFDQGGDDTYVIDVSAPRNGSLTIEEVAESGSNNVLTLQNVDAGDVHIFRSYDKKGLIVVADGEVVSWIPGQFEDLSKPLLDHVHIVPAVGSPVDVPVTNRDDFPVLSPEALPATLLNNIQPAFGSAISAASPLVIDLSTVHSGVTLTTWSASTTETFFDLNANGFAVQTAWISGDTGLLARDLNSNGNIDSSAELFGSPTVDGFAKLAALDSNHDLRIDNNDDDWSALVVWTDDNGDAVTESGELHSLSSLGIVNIDLAGVASSTSTISGNPISHTSKVTFSGGATATIADAWFVHDNTNSYYADDYTLDVETLFLPTLRGYGTLADLTIAMSQDSDLKELVADFATSFTLASFADAAALNADISEILYTWAGVADVDPGSRGPNIDGQQLAFLEHFVGTDFIQNMGQGPNPGSQAGHYLDQAYQKAIDMIAADLLLQVGASALFDGTVTYNPATGLPEGDTALSETAIGDLVGIAPAPGTGNVAFWDAIGRFIDNTRGFSNLTVDEQSWLDDAVQATDSTMHWTDVVDAVGDEVVGSTTSGTSGADTMNGGAYNDTISGFEGADTIHGNGGSDIIHGGNANDTLYGDAGRDTLYGEDGDDVMYGGDGNDTLYAGTGNNTLNGGAGGNVLNGGSYDDTFVYAGGNDVIVDSNGSDQIILPGGITLSDLSFKRVSTQDSTIDFTDLLISIEGAGTIQIQSQFHSSSSHHIETIVFDDTSTLTLSTLSSPDVYLTGGNDGFTTALTSNFDVYGLEGDDTIIFQSSGTHTIDGGAGNDLIDGGSGNDTIIASTGFDTIDDDGGTDTIVIPAAFDIDDVTLYRINNGSGPTNHLGISIEGLGEISVLNQFASTGGHQVEYLYFASDSSTLTLTSQSITTVGTAGNDNISAPAANAGANDVLDGREGNDNLTAGGGDDTYVFSAGHDVIISETGGDDAIRVRETFGTADITLAFVQYGFADTALQLTDSNGNTILVTNQSASTNNSVEHIAFGNGTTWNLNSIEVETHGTSGNDGYLAGHDIGDASSNDTIYGYGGNDVLSGGNGDDLLYGGDGTDTLNSSLGYDVLHGDAGNDTMYGSSYNTLYGDADNDSLRNNASSGSAASTLVTMYGGDGTDTLYGGYGTTVMNGGAGADTLTGWSSGIDVFTFDAATAFSAVDTLSGFLKTTGDKIDISDVLDGHYNPATDVLTNFVQIATNGSNSELYVDTTGSAAFGAGAHIATIQGVTGLTDEYALMTAGTLLAA